jgi:hypothetical protein
LDLCCNIIPWLASRAFIILEPCITPSCVAIPAKPFSSMTMIVRAFIY